MSLSLNPGQDHLDTIYRLVDYLLMRCGDRFDCDMQRPIDAVLESFNRYLAFDPPDNSRRERVTNPSLSQNYVSGQCAILCCFAHTVMALAVTPDGEILRKPVARLMESLNQNHEFFFLTSLFENRTES